MTQPRREVRVGFYFGLVRGPTIPRLKAEGGPVGGKPETGEKLQATLEKGSVEFIFENGGGAGRRPKRRKR